MKGDHLLGKKRQKYLLTAGRLSAILVNTQHLYSFHISPYA